MGTAPILRLWCSFSNGRPGKVGWSSTRINRDRRTHCLARPTTPARHPPLPSTQHPTATAHGKAALLATLAGVGANWPRALTCDAFAHRSRIHGPGHEDRNPITRCLHIFLRRANQFVSAVECFDQLGGAPGGDDLAFAFLELRNEMCHVVSLIGCGFSSPGFFRGPERCALQTRPENGPSVA